MEPKLGIQNEEFYQLILVIQIYRKDENIQQRDEAYKIEDIDKMGEDCDNEQRYFSVEVRFLYFFLILRAKQMLA